MIAAAVDGRPSEVTSATQYDTVPRIDHGVFVDAESRARRAIIDRFALTSGFSAFIVSQVPASAGLGSATAESIALIKAGSEFSGAFLSREELAALASQIEVDDLRLPLGRQDHYAICFGGLNCLTFTPQGVEVERIELAESLASELEDRLMLFHTGRPTDWRSILAERQRRIESNRANAIEALHATKETALGLLMDLRRGELGAVGSWLHRCWLSKKQLIPRTSDGWIDQWYEAALSAGATGGMIAGPGGGGFLLLDCDPGAQQRVTDVLLSFGLDRVEFGFDFDGATVLLNDGSGRGHMLRPVHPRGLGAR